MKLRVCLLVLAVMMMSTTAQAQSAKMAFASDQCEYDPFCQNSGVDIWRTDDDGTNQERLTTEVGDAQRPSITLNGSRTVYDSGGDLFMMRSNGIGPLPLTFGPGEDDPCLGNECEDPDAGPYIPTFGPPLDHDFLIVFTREFVGVESGDIFLATVDVSEGELVNVHQLTVPGPLDLTNYQPAWCGTDHVVWSREVPNTCDPCGATEEYGWELCFLEVDENGPIDPLAEPTCYLQDENETASQYPSCNLDGSMVAFAQSDGDLKDQQTGGFIEQPHEICTMDLNDLDPESTVKCFVNPDDLGNDLDDNKPVWSPGGSQLAFASNRDGDGVYDIWKINNDPPDALPVHVTTNIATDDDPDWGAALLP